MAVTNYAPGKIKPILYFMSQRGYIHMLPTDEESKRFRKRLRMEGFEMYAAETLHEAEVLQKKMQEQLRLEQEHELSKDEEMTRYRRQRIRDRLVARRNSASCGQFEMDYIDIWLVMREKKHDIFKKKFTSQMGHLDELEFDDPNKHIHDLHDRVK